MRRLHRRDHAEFAEPRQVGRIDNLRVFDAPAGFANFSLAGRHRVKGLLVKIEDHAVRAIANRVRLDLNAAAQGFLEHRFQLFGFFGEITGSFGRVTVWFQQSRAARAERAVQDHFERALREVVIVIVDGRSFYQKSLCIFPRPINRVDKAQFYFSLVETFSNYFDVVCIAAGVLNFAPAEFDLAIHCEKDRLLALSFSRLRNILRHQILRAIEQHSGRFAGRLVF